jgi:hypothetical protein
MKAPRLTGGADTFFERDLIDTEGDRGSTEHLGWPTIRSLLPGWLEGLFRLALSTNRADWLGPAVDRSGGAAHHRPRLRRAGAELLASAVRAAEK